jgi:peptidoglycan glycosyltransferase
MNRELKRISVLVVLMFAALLTSTSIIQVVQVDALDNDPRNVRTLYESYSAQRGPILVDGQPIAESVPVDDEYKFLRSYPQGDLYSAVTGYLTLGGQPTGIEGALNDDLSGSANSQFLDKINGILTGQEPIGDTVELTIDPVAQKAAYDALGDKTGAVVAIDPKTGAILALVSKPGFDPNQLSVHDTSQAESVYEALLDDPGQPLQNRAIAGDLPTPSTYQRPGSDSLVNNSEGGSCGGGSTATIATALRLSCNIPFAELGVQLGEKTIADMASSYGFGKELEIPMSVTPSTYPRGLDDAQLALSSFGQYTDRATPMQMAMVSAGIANGGVVMRPTLIDKILAPDLSVRQQLEPEEFSRPISDNTSATLTQMMVNGVENGAASNARIGGVSVAGKTGTAENGDEDPYTLWFTGFAPADNPQIAVAVVVEDGGGLGQEGYGNLVAAPIAKAVMEAVLNK